MSIGTIIGTVAKTVTSPRAKMAIDVIFYTSSALKVGTELARDWARDYEIRQKTDEKIKEIVKDEFKDYLIDNRDELAKRVMKPEEIEFLKKVSKASKAS